MSKKRPVSLSEMYTIRKFILHNLGIKVRIRWKSFEHADGYWVHYAGSGIHTIVIRFGLGRAAAIQTIFHEAMHAFCFERRIFPIFHGCGIDNGYSAEQARAYLRTGLRAEIWVDKWADRLLKRYNPRLKPPHPPSKKDIRSVLAEDRADFIRQGLLKPRSGYVKNKDG